MTQLAKACIQNMARVRGYEMYPMPEKEQGKNRKKSVSREEKRSVGSEKNSAKIFQIKQAHCQKIEMIY